MKMSARGMLCSALTILVLLLSLYSCRNDSIGEIFDDGGYPPEVNNIIIRHCTTGPTGGGCHNAIGAVNAAGLRLDSWENLFGGGNHGAVVIPYDTINSPLLHYINNDSALGPVSIPTMPYTGTNFSTTPLSRDEYTTIRDWIAAGAPDKNGNIPFGANAQDRQKIYITQQGSDILSVVDADRHVIMRNIPIGMTNNIESAHCVRVSQDGKYAYVSFLAGDYVQKIETSTDKVVDAVKIGDGHAQWNLLHISEDGSKVIVADFAYGVLKIISTATMDVIQSIPGGVFHNPHGMASTPAFDTIFITAQYGNTVIKLYADGNYKEVSIDGNKPTYGVGIRDPHEIMMTPDGSKYFLTCEASHEVRVLDTRTDAILAVIPVPTKPQEIAVSKSTHSMLVTCIEAPSPVVGAKGAVVSIDYEDLGAAPKIIWGDFWQPHGIAVDDRAGTFYVVSSNQSGPSSGHNHSAGGKHGWYNVYSLQTLQPLIERQYETLVLPYSADARIKP
jgi:DNA-binding beta-propeller fold protein YncE